MSHASSPIAIVGIGCRFAGADNLQAFWRVTLEGQDQFAPVPPDRWDAAAFFDANPRARDKSYAPTGAWIDDVRSFPTAFNVPPRRLDVTDPQQRLALECAIQAVTDAGLTAEAMPYRTGVYMGVTAVEYRTLSSARVMAQLMASGALGRAASPEDAAVLAGAVERLVATRPYTAPGLLSNMNAAFIAQELRLHGPAFSTDAACASALVALSSAVMALRTNQIDAALAGGVYICLTPEHHIAFSRIGAISKGGKCLPFDKRADGFVQGDGCGVVMLKRLADAERDGDRIYALLHGIAMNNDGGGSGPMAPVKEGQIEVIQAAWADAGLSPAGLGYVECHGTGTLVGDHIEFDGLSTALGAELAAAGGRAALGSSKANFGHTMSAAGIAGLLRAVMAIYHEKLPPMANFESPKADLPLAGSPFFIPKTAENWHPNASLACVSSFGFGGTNGHVIVGAAPKAVVASTTVATATQAELVCLSASNEALLAASAGDLANAIKADPQATLGGIARTLGKRPHEATRAAFVAATREELATKLEAFARGELPKGVVTGKAGDTAPKVAFLFPGQGAQRVGMLAGIRDRFPVVRDALLAMDDATRGVMGHPVSDYLYPERRGLADAERAAAELTDTENCQPALFAVGWALAQLLRQVGVTPVVTAGHSVGEFTAAAVAGLTSAEDGIRWCAKRGQGMQALTYRAGGDGTPDKGAMAALVCDRATAEQHLLPGANIANVNHPRQVVVSGFRDVVAAVAKRARAAGIEVTELRVSHGFHSGVFEGLDLGAVVDQIAMQESAVPVASCITESSYRDPEHAKDVFKRHARSPVLWTGALERCQAAGATVFLQVAAGGPLLSFVRGTLPGVPALSLASKEDADGGASLLEGLGALWTLGVPVDASAITAPGTQASLPPTLYERQTYWVVSDQPAEPIQLATLSGPGMAPKAASASVTPAQQPKAAPSADAGSRATDADQLTDVVYAAIAKASAYPRAALKPTMRLGDDLGFDSMMVADLAEELRKNIAGFVGIPQELLIQGPTIADILAFARSPAATAGSAATDASMDDLPLGRFAPTWIPAPLPNWGGTELPPAGTFVAIGEGVETFAQALLTKGWTRVTGAAGASATLLVFGTPAGAPVPVSAVLAGEVAAPDYTGPLMALLDAAAKAGATPHVMLLRRDDDPWAEAATGVVRSVAREWSHVPNSIVKSIRGGHALTAAQLLAELGSFDRTTDVRWVDGVRSVAGTAALPAIADAELWQPGANDVVAVTGGTRGIGLALATELAAAGAKVLVVGRNAPGALPAGVQAVAVDVTDRDGLRRALEGRGVTTLVHAAGVLADGPLGQVDAAVGAHARAVKVDGLVNAIHALGSGLERVLVVGSWAGRFGNRHQAYYAAANALAAELVNHLPSRIQAAVSEFGPWTDSDMVRSIPPAVQQAMRSEGVDFVGNLSGLRALREDLSARGIVVRGRQSVPQTTRRALRTTTLATESHPYLKDHAVQGTPVFPLAAAATTLAEIAALTAPFEIRDLTLFQGVAVTEPVALEASVQGDKAELRQGDKRTLSYRATVAPLGAPLDAMVGTPTIAPARAGGAPPTTLSLAQFYGGITFHGPLLQGITSIDRIGEDFVVGRVKTSRPGDWMRLTDQPAWAIDPLAFDSAMQLAAYVAYVRYGRAGTPVGFARFVQLAPWPAGEILAEASFKPGDNDKLEADLVFRTLDGTPIAAAWGVTADMKKVEQTAAPSPAAPAPQAVAPAPAPAQEEPAFVVKPEWVDASKWRGYKDLAMRLHAVEAMGLKNPFFDLHDGTAKNVTHIAGREIINYSSYNYLGLSGDPRVLDEVEIAVRKYGTSVSASRVASGERPFHRALEAALAKAHGVDDALVMAGGHATNVNTIGHLFGVKDLVLHDELIHDSCLQGIKLSGAARRSFKHEDMAHLEAQLKELRRHYEKVLLLVEGVYSMDGDVTNLPALIRLKKQYGCMLMVDEAHSFGTVGKTGRGVGELWGLDEPGHELNRRDVDIWMGTMSKSLASMGGWVAGRKELILYLRYTTPGFVFAAGIPPALGQAALSSLNYMLAEPWRVADLQRNAKRFWELLAARGLDTGPATGDSPVIPVITGDSMWALKLSERLLDRGINAKPIIFPAVANDAARLRFFMTSLHTEAQLVYTADRIAETLAQIRAEDPKKPAPKSKA